MTAPAHGAATLPSAAQSARAPVLTSGAVALVTVLSTLTLAVVAVVVVRDSRAPSPVDWHVIWVLAVVGVIGIAAEFRFRHADDDATPPWDVHTVWILPAALLTPPAAFGTLVALSVVASMFKRPHALRWRIVVACTTVLTTAAVHVAARVVGPFVASALVGIVALWVVGAAIALVMARVIGTPSGTALWLDVRWTLVEIGCALTGTLIGAAMLTDPNLGLAGVAPVLFAAFALRWPELTWYARIDAKTGLPNAWHWQERTLDLLPAAELKGTPAAVMIIDIDHFKLVNDTYGHLAGDQVLLQLADVLRADLRRGDLVGRFGGEEFVMTTFGLSPAGARAAAERVRRAVAGQRHQLSGPRGLDSCSVTCTVGVASSDRYGYDLMRMLDMADVALAKGKAAGRNQVHVAQGARRGGEARGVRPGAGRRVRSVWSLAARRRASGRTVARRPGVR